MARLWISIFVLISAAAAQSGQSSVSGTVIDTWSGDPVRKAIVTLTWQGTPRTWATARTDGSGRFKFEGLPAGKYDLRAMKPNLGTAVYGANSLMELGDVLTLGNNEARDGLKLRFLRAGLLSGHVSDPDGTPITSANVSLLRATRNLGERVLVNYRSVRTDDRGEYRIENVDAGEYYLLCNADARFRAPNRPSGLISERLAPQYYGGGKDSKDAQLLKLRGGEALTGFDFRMAIEPVGELRGRVTGVPDDGPSIDPQPVARGQKVAKSVRRVDVSLAPVDSNQQQAANGVGAQAPDFRFEFPEIPAGRYRIEAMVRSPEKTYAASQVVDFRPNSGDVILSLAPAVDVPGHLQIEGGTAGNPLQVTLIRPGNRYENRSSTVGKDGSFTLKQVPPGEWEININTVPRNGFVKSVHLGDKDVRFERLEIQSGPEVPLNIVISMNSSRLEGGVDSGGEDFRRAGILLAPVGKFHDLMRFYYRVAADDEGRFQIQGVAPGKYRLYALEKMNSANFANPEAADQLGDLGEEIELKEGATLQAHPKLIPAERARLAIQ